MYIPVYIDFSTFDNFDNSTYEQNITELLYRQHHRFSVIYWLSGHCSWYSNGLVGCLYI